MKKNITLSILSGLLLWIAWPPTPYTSFFLFFGFVPVLIAIENIINSNYTKKGKKIFWTSFLGFFIWNSYVGGSYNQIVVGMISIGIAGYISSALLRKLGELATPWLQEQ